MTFSIDNPKGCCNNPPLRKICLGKTLRRTRVKPVLWNPNRPASLTSRFRCGPSLIKVTPYFQTRSNWCELACQTNVPILPSRPLKLESTYWVEFALLEHFIVNCSRNFKKALKFKYAKQIFRFWSKQYLTVLIHNIKTAWATRISLPFLSFWTVYFKMYVTDLLILDTCIAL